MLGFPNATIDDNIGGYQNDAGEKIVEISNKIDLKDATIEEAAEFAAMAAVIAPEVQEASIALRYVKENSPNHNANEYSVKVGDIDKAIDALKSAGIYNFSIDEKNKTVSFIDVFEYQDPNNPDGPPIKVKLKDYLSQSYVIIENKKDNSTGKAGTYSLWPKDVVLDRIYNNGFQPEQFKNIWKFDDDQVKQIKDQLNPYFENAKDIYNKNMSEEVLKQMGETGKTPEEIISGFSKKVGKPKYLAKPIQDFVNTTIENYTKAIQDETNKSEIEDYKGFDFLHATRQVWVDKETGKETKKGAKNAVLIGETFDPEKYYDYWVNQGKTEKEKAERRKKINDIKNKYGQYLPDLKTEQDYLNNMSTVMTVLNTELAKKFQIMKLQGVADKQLQRSVQLAEQEEKLTREIAKQR